VFTKSEFMFSMPLLAEKLIKKIKLNFF
jgi:hypothetical protein